MGDHRPLPPLSARRLDKLGAALYFHLSPDPVQHFPVLAMRTSFQPKVKIGRGTALLYTSKGPAHGDACWEKNGMKHGSGGEWIVQELHGVAARHLAALPSTILRHCSMV